LADALRPDTWAENPIALTSINNRYSFNIVALLPVRVDGVFYARSIGPVNKRLLEGFGSRAYVGSMAEKWTGEHLRELSTRALAVLKPLVPRRFRSDIPVVPVVRLAGIIGISAPLRPSLTLAGLARALDRAFAVRHARAVALSINSPGGSPVQSHLIFRRIRTLAEEHKIPVLAFVEDAAASGGYMLACAADEIVADPSSIVGSIGVVGGSFGFDKLIAKIGVERRLYTSGEHKAMLDPFLPENAEDVERLKELQQAIHRDFIALVKSRRGGKLDGGKDDLFSGAYWTGGRALELGLVDALGDLRTVLRERYGDKVVTPLIAVERGLFGRRTPGVEWDGSARASLADEVISALEARALWARYGL
jgi:serine protease SohB